MKDILYLDAFLQDTLTKPCMKCEHPRGTHPHDRKCEMKHCPCKSFHSNAGKDLNTS